MTNLPSFLAPSSLYYTFKQDVTEGCSANNVISSFQSTCNDYTFKLTLEYFYGSQSCVTPAWCSEDICYDKSEFFTGICIDQTFETIGGIAVLSSYEASFDCFSESWFFYFLLVVGFFVCCVCPCVCLCNCCKRMGSK